jgi:Helix-loop-helix DNA-binding domain
MVVRAMNSPNDRTNHKSDDVGNKSVNADNETVGRVLTSSLHIDPLAIPSRDQHFESTLSLIRAYGETNIFVNSLAEASLSPARNRSNIDNHNEETSMSKSLRSSDDSEKCIKPLIASKNNRSAFGKLRDTVDSKVVFDSSCNVVQDDVEEFSSCNSNVGRTKSSRMDSVPEEKLVKKKRRKNEREKERSSRIAKQILELQQLLSKGGVECLRGTRRSILDEAISYIKNLQQLQNKV